MVSFKIFHLAPSSFLLLHRRCFRAWFYQVEGLQLLDKRQNRNKVKKKKKFYFSEIGSGEEEALYDFRGLITHGAVNNIQAIKKYISM